MNEQHGRACSVSIIMAVLNAEAYLVQAIESVFLQTTSASWELLIVDDGSSDHSLALAEQYAHRFPHCVRVLRHPGGTNRGASASRNLALAEAQGEFIAFLDADDVWLPDMLVRQLGTLRQWPEVSMVYANAERWWNFDLPFAPDVGSLGDNTLPPLLPREFCAGLLEPPSLLRIFRADETMTPCTCTVVVRAEAARRLGGFVNDFRGLFDDQAFYAKFALQELIWVNLDCVARYRRHAASTCVQAWNDEARTARERTRFERWLANYQASLQGTTPALHTEGSRLVGVVD